MLLYHGSPQIVRTPCILVPNRTLDYGIGFYTTTSEQQAHDWVLRFFFISHTICKLRKNGLYLRLTAEKCMPYTYFRT